MGSSQDDTVYLVLDDFGRFGQAYRETDPEQADRQTVLSNLLSGQYSRPLRIRGVQHDRGLGARCDGRVRHRGFDPGTTLSATAREFVEGVMPTSSLACVAILPSLLLE